MVFHARAHGVGASLVVKLGEGDVSRHRLPMRIGRLLRSFPACRMPHAVPQS